MLMMLKTWFGLGGDLFTRRGRLRGFRPHLEGLEERWCPVVDNFWRPAAGGNLLWSTAANWSLNHDPTESERAVFEGTAAGDKDCTLDMIQEVVGGFLFSGYTKTLTLGTGTGASNHAILYILEDADLSNGFDQSQVARIDFANSNSKLHLGVDGEPVYTARLGTFDFTGQQGQFVVGGTTHLDLRIYLDSFTKADFVVNGEVETETFSGEDIAFIGSANLLINSGGHFLMHGPDRETVLHRTGTENTIVVKGQLSLRGGNNTTQTIDMPILVADGGYLGVDTGSWNIRGSSTLTSGKSVLMTDSGSTVHLTYTIGGNGAELDADLGYYQIEGTFSTGSNTTVSLIALNGSITFIGGIVDPGGVGYIGHVLFFGSTDMEVTIGQHATYKADIKDNVESDRLEGFFDVDFDIINGATLVVNRIGNVPAGELSYLLIEDTRQTPDALEDFTNKTIPQGLFTGPLANGNYRLTNTV